MSARRSIWSRILWGLLAAALLAGWLGLKVPPDPFPPVTAASAEPEVVSLPARLPAPVDRFYRRAYGEYVPVVTSAVVTGRATLRPLTLGSLAPGPALPARFRFTHDAGRGYRHDTEITWFRRTALRLDESYLGGVSRQRGPFTTGPLATGLLGSSEGEPQGAQAANLSLWAEALWFPSLYLTDSRVRWEALDDETAVLSVPSGAGRERFIVRFDPATGRPFLLEAMRHRDVRTTGKTLWLVRVLAWGEFGGVTLPRVVALTWEGEGRPHAVFTAENVVSNVNVRQLLEATRERE